MADISKVTASNGTTYDIKDATARSNLSDKMDKVNPTGTGALSINRKSNTTVGSNSTATGDDTTASGYASHAEGEETTASGRSSHAEGRQTTASGGQSHTEGEYSEASGIDSHAEGLGTIAASDAQHVGGKYNIADNADTYAEIIGNGTSDSTRSNARTLDWQGNETISGDFFFNGGATGLTAQLSGKQNTLTAGANINISGDTISATDTKPTGLTADNNPSASAMVSSGNWNDLYKLPLTAGKLYLISVAAQFASNSNGCRSVGIRNNTYTPMGIIYQQTVQAANGAATNVVWTGFFTPQAEEEYYVIARQYNSSNTSINCTYRYRYVALT